MKNMAAKSPSRQRNSGKPKHTRQAARRDAVDEQMRPSPSRTDVVHLVLLLGALALAYMLPFELVVLSYAILGPAHYLTEISWLHDRKYYLPHRGIALVLGVIALGAMFMADPNWLGILILFVLIACAILANVRTPAKAALFLAIAVGSFAALRWAGVPFGIAWVLVPTLVHVSLFTFVFMTVGAVKARSLAQGILVVIYVASIVSIVAFPPSSATVMPPLAALAKDYFGDVASALGSVLGIPHLTFDARVTGLLSFVYTYHYLNWFVKADVIRWASVPKPRLIGIATLSVAATALYFYNYAYGFMVLLLLSLIHVLLEFPLNSLSIRDFGTVIIGGIARTRRVTFTAS